MLPATVPLADAAFNAARTALLVRALTGTPELLFEATEDRLHQGYRAAAMPGTKNLLSALRERDIAAVVSGAGPSVLALVPDERDLLQPGAEPVPGRLVRQVAAHRGRGRASHGPAGTQGPAGGQALPGPLGPAAQGARSLPLRAPMRDYMSMRPHFLARAARLPRSRMTFRRLAAGHDWSAPRTADRGCRWAAQDQARPSSPPDPRRPAGPARRDEQ